MTFLTNHRNSKHAAFLITVPYRSFAHIPPGSLMQSKCLSLGQGLGVNALWCLKEQVKACRLLKPAGNPCSWLCLSPFQCEFLTFDVSFIFFIVSMGGKWGEMGKKIFSKCFVIKGMLSVYAKNQSMLKITCVEFQFVLMLGCCSPHQCHTAFEMDKRLHWYDDDDGGFGWVVLLDKYYKLKGWTKYHVGW